MGGGVPTGKDLKLDLDCPEKDQETTPARSIPSRTKGKRKRGPKL